MTQIERIPANRLAEWRAVTDAVQHNELLGAVMSVGNEQDMQRALVQPVADPDRPPRRRLLRMFCGLAWFRQILAKLQL